MLLRRRRRDEDEDETVSDMTPMIDMVFLLLVFFLLTSRFVPTEKVIASLLPTDQGPGIENHPIPHETIRLAIYPAQFARGSQPSEYDRAWKDAHDARQAFLRLGNHEPLLLTGAELDRPAEGPTAALAQVHAYLAQHLAAFEGLGERTELPPIEIHGFTGLPWKYVLAVYDGVRAFEAARGADPVDASRLSLARQVNFAPPRVRAGIEHELGQELWEILHLR